ncbi:MAG: hypothetical protein CENE_03304 [Candidatus Celerinatantimonas neptuna]|nr:MAG: hypothetical protein CENE_03304 [Candidatus Celerinatantimonas neptuna]
MPVDLFEHIQNQFNECFDIDPIPARDPSWHGPLPGEQVLNRETCERGLARCAALRQMLDSKQQSHSRLNARLQAWGGGQHG